MTVETAEAMATLGEHYYTQKNLHDAFTWHSRAARQGYLPSIRRAAQIGKQLAGVQEKAEDWEGALKSWDAIREFDKMLANHPDATGDDMEMMNQFYYDSLYGKGLALFMLGNYDFAVQFLRSAERHGVPGAKITLGQCLFELKKAAGAPEIQAVREDSRLSPLKPEALPE